MDTTSCVRFDPADPQAAHVLLTVLRPFSRRLSAIVAVGLALVCALGGSATAQTTGSVAGYAYEEGTRKPLSAVRVSIDGTDLGSLTDQDGFYEIRASRRARIV